MSCHYEGVCTSGTTGVCLGLWLPKGYQVGGVDSKSLIFMRFHVVFLGNQHEIWSKQHNGKQDLTHYLGENENW
jgi:hypothetical protein